MMMRINYIYEEVLAKTVEVKYINTHNQVADILTEPLVHEQYTVLSTSYALVESPCSG
jgi:hypothetical protein